MIDPNGNVITVQHFANAALTITDTVGRTITLNTGATDSQGGQTRALVYTDAHGSPAQISFSSSIGPNSTQATPPLYLNSCLIKPRDLIPITKVPQRPILLLSEALA